ncbi:SNF related kinase b [Gadus morhua]|uniref:SNF related kinase b n=1 Tax=Gadus morhua TaxID=8049 RepID=UPI0011B6F4F6|nr:myristoylated alanine-rich C-kinase substrate-like [Gadus morhua]XP_030222923.1 myristoylated alanine-rich C-kinase substrate-like [Gadus morhua]
MLVCGVPPFQETNDSETLVMILDCRYSVPEHVSDGCRDLISRMLQKDPACRATLAEIEAHDWLAGLDDALLSPEAPPHWLSGALSASSLRPGLPESGDLLAARPPALQPGPGTWQPSLGHRRAPPEAPVVRTPAALGQICEDEEEEEEEEGEGGEGGSSRAPPQAPQESAAVEPETAGPLGGEELQPANAMELGEDGEEGEGEGEGEAAFGSGGRGGRRVISDQPVGNGNEALGCGAEGPPSSGPRRFMGVQCCHGEPDPTAPGATAAAMGAEPNNNANAPLHLPPPQTSAPLSALPSPPSELSLNGHGAKTPGNAVERDDFLRDQAHNASGSETAGRTEPSKARSIKLKDRLFQFPLCEKALAFNIPTHNKAKVLPLAQYNCCHVL